MAGYGSRRLFGIFCLLLLLALVIRGYYEVPERWGEMPATEYVAEHIGLFEGKRIIVDGTASDVRADGNRTRFCLNPVAKGVFSKLEVAAAASSPAEGQGGVNVQGTVRNGVLEADVIRVSPIPWYMESFYNLAGLFFFLFFSVREWRIKKAFPYLEEVA